jgi:hypothetical protein
VTIINAIGITILLVLSLEWGRGSAREVDSGLVETAATPTVGEPQARSSSMSG